MNPINKNKIIILFSIFIFYFLFPATVFSRDKEITIREKNISIEKAFELIEKQTGYTVAYSGSTIKLKKKISVFLENASLPQALEKILKNSGHTYKINGYHIILIPLSENDKSKKVTSKTPQTISGRVVERETGDPVGYASITLLDHLSKGAIADSLGYFKLENIPGGPYNLKVSVVGYSTAVFRNVTPLPDENIILDISSNDHNYYLEEVVITGSGKAENIIQSPQMGMLSMSRAEIKNIPVLFGEADVIKALQTQPGVVAGIEGLAGMYVRGGNGDENLYMIDGNPLYQINHLGGIFSAFHTEAVRDMDFYKSAFPAKYGGRLSSVVDVHFKDGNPTEYHGTATLGLTSGSLNFEGPLIKEKTTFNVSLRRSWLDVLSIPALAIINNKDKKDGKKTTAGYAFTDLSLKVKHRFSDRSYGYLNFYFGEDRLKFGIKEFSVGESDPFQNQDINKLRWGNLLIAPGWSCSFNNKLSGDIKASYTRYASTLKRSICEVTGEKGDPEYEKIFIENSSENGIEDFGLRADFNYNVGPNRILFGAHYIHHRFRPEYVKSTSSIDYSTPDSKETLAGNEFNLYIQDNRELLPFWSIHTGLRLVGYDNREETSFHLEPRISTRFLLSPDLSLKASYSRMNQFVQQVSDSYISLPTDFWMPVGKNRKPLTADQLSAGIYYKLTNSYSFSGETYYKWMNNLLDYKDGYNFLPSTSGWENKLTSGKGRAYGVDFIATKETGCITGYIGYGLMWSDRRFAEINEGKTFPSKYDNRHKINIVVNYKLNKKIEFNGSWTYMTGNRVTLSLENYQPLHQSGFHPDLTPGSIDSSNGGLDYYDKKNNIRLPDYHRLDLGINIYCPKKNGRIGIWNISVYNAYCRMNPIVITKESIYSGGSVVHNMHSRFRTLSIFPIIPSVSYTYKF